MTKLISVHFPKSAGSSLASLYDGAFGPDLVLREYAHDPVDPCGLINVDPDRYAAARPESLGSHEVVHGHFHVGLYDRVQHAVRVVALREPIDNLISIYFHWDSMRRAGAAGHALFQRFCRANLTLLEFATIPNLRYLASRCYFRDVDMGRFDLVGDFSVLSEFVAGVSSLVGVELGPLPLLNVTPQSEERQRIMNDARTLVRLRSLLVDDLRFYERHAST